MKSRNPLKQKTVNPSENIVIVIKAKMVIKVFRFVWGLFDRDKQRKNNKTVDKKRVKHLADRHNPPDNFPGN